MNIIKSDISLGYLFLRTNNAAVGQHVTTSSPSFTASGDNCLSFDYEVWGSPLGPVNTPAPRLEIYIRNSRHMYSGWKLWVLDGTGDGHAQISVRTYRGSTYWISFVGVVGHPDTSSISVANIQLKQGNCTDVDCIHGVCGVHEDNFSSISNS